MIALMRWIFRKIAHLCWAVLITTGFSFSSEVQVSEGADQPVLEDSVLVVGVPLAVAEIKPYIQQQYDLIQGKDLILWGVALFGGTDLISSVIKEITGSIWSHCGLIFKDQNGIQYCLESTGSAGEVLSGEMPQVQIHKWDDVAKGYSGRVGHRELNITDMGRNTPVYNNPKVRDLIGKPYESNILVLVSSVVRGNKVATPNSLFCSEMNAEYLSDIGYLSSSRLPDNYLPKDFAADNLPLQSATIGEIVQDKHSRGIIGKVASIGWKIADRIEKILEKLM